MKVYSFASQKTKPKQNRPGLFNLGSTNYSGHKRYNNRHTKFNPFSFLENKTASQIFAILSLTVAVFIAVQGLFGSSNINSTAQAAGVDDNLKLIINYSADSADSKNLDSSKIVDSVDSPKTTQAVAPVTETAVKVQTLSTTKTQSAPTANKK